MTKEQQLDLIYRHTHQDFKGRLQDGTRTILVMRQGEGTCLVPLECLTDAEIGDKFPYAEKLEARRAQRYADKLARSKSARWAAK